jgi:hypothetical protein
MAQAQLAIGQKRPEDGVAFLRTGLADAELARNRYLALRVNVQLAIAELLAGQPDKAVMVLRDAVADAAPAGVSQSIVAYGIHIGPLLVELE